MSIKQYTHEEFDQLIATEYGDTLPRPFLIQSFDVEEVQDEDFDWETPKKSALKGLPVNVTEPGMYTDRKGQMMVLLPHANPTYDLINSFFPVKGAWMYTISDSVGAELHDRYYYHRYGKNEVDGNVPLPRYNPHDITTH